MAKKKQVSARVRDKAVQQALSSNTPIAQVAREHKIKAHTLRYWVKRASNGQPNPQHNGDDRKHEYYASLERENVSLRNTNDTLMKALSLAIRQSA
jgi:transposase-like protein